MWGGVWACVEGAADSVVLVHVHKKFNSLVAVSHSHDSGVTFLSFWALVCVHVCSKAFTTCYFSIFNCCTLGSQIEGNLGK